MKSLTIQLTEEQKENIEKIAEQKDISKSKVIRNRLSQYESLIDQCEELRSQLEAKENRIEELRSQLQAVNSKSKEIETIQNKIERQEQALKSQQEALNTPFFVRWYKWIRGNSSNNLENSE